MKKLIILIAIILIAWGVYALVTPGSEEVDLSHDESMMEEEKKDDSMMEEEEAKQEAETVIGASVEKRAITAHHYYGSEETDTEVLFVGGIHGGYSWNTALVAFDIMDYLEETPGVIPANVKVTVIPVLNPDGLEAVVGTDGRFTSSDVPTAESVRIAGRFNANNVDLNRNFDCDWEAEGVWQSRTVDAGTAAFSEPEAQALKNYVEATNPNAVVVYYSAAGGVFASNCHDGVLSETNELTDIYADASGYEAYQTFDFYEITGDATNWLAKEGVPAISVLLSNHTDVEATKNRSGVEAILQNYEN